LSEEEQQHFQADSQIVIVQKRQLLFLNPLNGEVQRSYMIEDGDSSLFIVS